MMKKLDKKTQKKLLFKFKESDKTRESHLEKIDISSDLSSGIVKTEAEDDFKKVFKQTTGTESPENALSLINHLTRGMPGSEEERLNETAALLPLLEPKNPTETLLLGQFLSLQKGANACLQKFYQNANNPAGERFAGLASKLSSQANSTMQTLIKYRAGGQNLIQFVHLHNEGGKAIVTQQLTSSPQNSEDFEN